MSLGRRTRRSTLEEALRIEKELDDIRVGDGYSNLRR